MLILYMHDHITQVHYIITVYMYQRKKILFPQCNMPISFFGILRLHLYLVQPGSLGKNKFPQWSTSILRLPLT